MLEKIFALAKHGTSVQTEIIAGVTTFVTMVYILALNPSILGASGMDKGAILTATAVSSAIACLAMALLANKPFALSAGLGLNAYFAYTVCGQMGFSWQVALTAVLVEGIIFVVLSLTNIREAIFNSIPASLKTAVGVGIGFFITFIGLQSSGLIVDGPTLVSLFSLKASFATGAFNTQGIAVLLTVVGTLLIAYMFIKKVKGYMLWGILLTWVIGMILQAVGVYIPNPKAGYYSLIPTAIFSMPASMTATMFKFDFSFISSHFTDFVVVLFAFLFVDIFDTIGTVIGCAEKSGMLDKDGKLPEIKGILLADAIGTTVGSCFGTSTITTFVESSSGIAEGGRTGLTSVVSGILFLLALFFSPLFLTIPSFATAPALIFVGFLMLQQVSKIDWQDLVKAIPCFITITMMGFAYSISDGIAFGFVAYTILHLLTGRRKELSCLMYILTLIFIVKYFII